MNSAEGSTVIGKSVVIRGELSGSEDLFIDGDIEGTITLNESKLTVGPNARIRANVTVRDLVVLGHLVGNVHASGRVDLRQSSSLHGDIVAGRLSIEESARLKGGVELKNSSAANSPSISTSATPQEAATTATPLFSAAKN